MLHNVSQCFAINPAICLNDAPLSFISAMMPTPLKLRPVRSSQLPEHRWRCFIAVVVKEKSTRPEFVFLIHRSGAVVPQPGYIR
jgi:hypothetical protein